MEERAFIDFEAKLQTVESSLQMLQKKDDSAGFVQQCVRLIEMLFPHPFTTEQEQHILALFATCKPRMQALYTQFVCEQEVRYAQKIVAEGIATPESLEDYLDVVVQNEMQFLNLTTNSTVLDIGIGPLPITACTYVKNTGCTVHGYEINPEYAAISREVVSLFGLSEKIHIHNKDGIEFAGGNYDATLVAMYSFPKTDIAQTLVRTTNKKTQLVFRSAEGLMQLFAPDNVDSQFLLNHSDRVYESKITLQTNFDGR